MTDYRKMNEFQNKMKEEYKTIFFIEYETGAVDTVIGWLSYFDTVSSDEAFDGFKGNIFEIFDNFVMFSDLRPVRACTFIWIDTKERDCYGDRIFIPAIDEFYGTPGQALRECERWGWFYDDNFTACGSCEMDYFDMMGELSTLGAEWFTDETNRYTSDTVKKYLYKGEG